MELITSLPAQRQTEVTSGLRVRLYAMDVVGLVHAMLLRVQVLLLPIKTPVFSGH